MRRTVKYGLIAVLATVFIGAGAWGAAWLTGTPDGARWLLNAISRHTPLTISARQVEGRLLGRLRLQGVRLNLAPLVVEIESLDYRWRPLFFVSGRMAAQELTLAGVQIQDNTPRGIQPDLSWPRISGIAGLFDGGIERLRVNGLTYRRLDGQPIQVNAISAFLSWRKAMLVVSDLAVASPDGQIAGSMSARFDRPSLQVDLTAAPTKPYAGMNRFSFQGRFLPGIGAEQLAGKFAVAGAKGKENFLEMAGDLGLTKNSLNFRQLSLTERGRRGAIGGGGTITLTAAAPQLALELTAAGIDLSPELTAPTDLSGTLILAGTPDLYQGMFKLASRGKGWQAADLSCSYSGNLAGVRMASLSGSLLAGSLQGNLAIHWGREVFLEGSVRGRNMNPAMISPDWTGKINVDFAGGIAWPDQGPPQGKIRGRLLESRLHKQALSGEVQADFNGEDLDIGRLVLRGRGFDISAAGILGKRLAFNAQVSQLGHLIPQTAGELRADGWVRRQDGRFSGAVAARGEHLAAGALRIAALNLNVRLGEEKMNHMHATAKLNKVTYDGFQVDLMTLAADGTALKHTIQAALSSTGAEAQIGLAGAYRQRSWQGEIVRFSGRDSVGPWMLERPARLSFAAGRAVLAPFMLTGVKPERIEIAGELNTETVNGSAQATWNGLNLARINPWLPRNLQRDLHLEGRLAGRVAGDILPGKKLDLAGEISLTPGKIRWQKESTAVAADLASADLSWRWQGALPASAAEIVAGQLMVAGRIAVSGSVTTDGHKMSLERGALNLDGNERGLRAGMELTMAGGGMVKGTFSSVAPARLAQPENGDITAEWKGVDLALLRPWLPRTVNLEGSLGGRATGRLLPGRKLDLKGDATLAGGKLRWLRPEGEINLNLRLASLSWDWVGEKLRGDAALALMEQGQARGTFQLPISARLPVIFNRKGPLVATLTGQVLEKGLLASLFPGFIRESRGELDADLQVGGTWEEPTLKGSLKLAKAGAYLPTAGIHVSDVQLAMQLEKNLLRIDSFRAVSGPGYIEGKAQVMISGWQVASYHGSMNGERFQFVYLPELQILGSPRLMFEGTMEKLAIRGEMRLPDLLIYGPPTRSVILPSRDVILEGAPKQVEKTIPFALDVQIRLTLGERVLAKLEGLDAQLGGEIDLMFHSLDKIASKGEIKVVKGRYRAYGVNLEIIRGRLFYAGGPINQPTLDILALRTVGDVRAGITAGGILRAPLIKLYAEPAMPDVDILAYIVFGRPLGTSSAEQAGMMAQVAGVLLSRGQSAVLQDQIKNRLGLSTLELQSGSTAAMGGYKAIPVAPAGVTSANPATGVSQTMLTVGKYLTPQLYFSYGRSLFTGGNLFRLRYDIFKRWQIETQTGSESGVDLYYKIEFD